MKYLTHQEKVAVMKILLDIMRADDIIDSREEAFFAHVSTIIDLSDVPLPEIEAFNSLIALTIIRDFSPEQKADFARLMGGMIVADADINYNEVKIYDVVNEFCGINADFDSDELLHSSDFVI